MEKKIVIIHVTGKKNYKHIARNKHVYFVPINEIYWLCTNLTLS